MGMSGKGVAKHTQLQHTAPQRWYSCIWCNVITVCEEARPHCWWKLQGYARCCPVMFGDAVGSQWRGLWVMGHGCTSAAYKYRCGVQVQTRCTSTDTAYSLHKMYSVQKFSAVVLRAAFLHPLHYLITRSRLARAAAAPTLSESGALAAVVDIGAFGTPVATLAARARGAARAATAPARAALRS